MATSEPLGEDPRPGSDAEQRVLPWMRLDELLAEVQARLDAVLATRDRMRALLDAVVSVGADLEAEVVLRRIVETAVRLAGARYGALGVVGEEGQLVQFIPVGMTEEEIADVPGCPHGLGVIGLLVQDPRPLRLADVSEHPGSYGFPPGHPPMRSFLGVPVRGGDEVFGNLYLTEKQGGAEFDEDDENAVVALAAAAGVAIENARLYDEARRRERWLQASAEVSTSLLSGTDPDEVLTLIARLAREMAGGVLAGVALPAAGGQALSVEVADGEYADQARGTTLPLSGSLIGQVFSEGTPRMIVDVRQEPEATWLLGRLPLGPALLIPLGAPGAVRGVLVAAFSPGRPSFPEATQGMLHAFAGQAAVALELAERRRSAERLIVMEDRDRIARDLHDIVIQRMFASGMTLMGVAKLTDQSEVGTRVQRVVNDLDETIRQIRSAIFALQGPPEEVQPSLRARVLAEVQVARDTLGFAPGVQLDGRVDTAVPEDVGGQLVIVLREALSNVARHAHAHHASVAVAVEDQQVSLRVEDDGVGLPPGASWSGLRNLAERAAGLRGGFDAAPREGGGTVVEWCVPLPYHGNG